MRHPICRKPSVPGAQAVGMMPGDAASRPASVDDTVNLDQAVWPCTARHTKEALRPVGSSLLPSSLEPWVRRRVGMA